MPEIIRESSPDGALIDNIAEDTQKIPKKKRFLLLGTIIEGSSNSHFLMMSALEAIGIDNFHLLFNYCMKI